MTQEEFHKRYQYSPTNDCLGEGGFGKVFKAYDTHLDKWVAIKMAEVKAGLEQVRLKHEVEIVNKLPTHPNIAKYDECYTFTSFTGEYDFAVLQYYESGNLQQLLETKQLTEQQKDSILRQILAGIEFLHNQGIIHRDLKPQNILIVNRNGEYIPKITDFGISKKLDANKSSIFTNSLAGVGTLAYASPEQLRGQTIKKNSDLWSFGVIVCWIFTGELPFTSGNQAVTSEAGRIELFKQITAGDVSDLIQQLPSIWSKLVKQCIVVDNEKRISNASNCLNILSGMINRFENKTTVIEEKTVTDIDGNVYKTVQIGNQIWMEENLKVSRYRNGDLILNIKDDHEWTELNKGAWCNYNNDIKVGEINGKLYNWYAVNDERKLAPDGWHVATDEEWQTFYSKLINESSSAIVAEIESRFNTLLSGGRHQEDGEFVFLNRNAFWWSSNQFNNTKALFRMRGIDNNLILGSKVDFQAGYSIRCVKDIIDDKNSNLLNEKTNSIKNTEVLNVGNPIKRKYNVVKSSVSKDELVTDIDGNIYHIIRIGNQEWLVENLRTTRYRNGDLIKTTIPATKDYSNEIEPKYQWAYDGDERYVEKFGRLYTWYAATDNRGITPKGWRIASNNDWNKLKEYLNSNGYNAKAIAANSCWHLSDSKSAVIGNNLSDNNKLLFKAFPSGYRVDKEYTNRNKPNPMFRDMGTHCYWWSSNELDIINVMSKSLYFHGDRINDIMFRKGCGHSIRCVRDV